MIWTAEIETNREAGITLPRSGAVSLKIAVIFKFFLTLSFMLSFMLSFIFSSNRALSAGKCAGTVHGQLTIEVTSCKRVSPQSRFSNPSSLPVWVKDMDSAQVKRLLESYQGFLLVGVVKKSSASIHVGLVQDHHALLSRKIEIFSPKLPGGCGKVARNRIVGVIAEQCCDGGGESPCFLGTPYLFRQAKLQRVNAKILGADKVSSLQKKAHIFLRQKKISKAIKTFEKALEIGSLDYKGQFFLAQAYEKQGKCRLALSKLKNIYRAWLKGDTSNKEDEIVGPVILLQARCHAQQGESSSAITALGVLLKRPKQFRKQIRQALIHSDFSWVRSTSGYKRFSSTARRILQGS